MKIIEDIKDTVKETTENITESIDSRIRNPFVISYLVSLVVFSWKPISVFFMSKLDIFRTIECIENPTYDYSVYSSFGYPILIALFYAFGLPFLDAVRGLVLEIAENLTLYRSEKRLEYLEKKEKLAIQKSDIKERVSFKRRISELESKNNEYEKSEENYQMEITDLNNKVTNLQNVYNESVSIRKTIQNENQELITNLNNNELRYENERIKSAEREQGLIKNINTLNASFDRINKWRNLTISKMRELGQEFLDLSSSPKFDNFKKMIHNWSDNRDDFHNHLSEIERKEYLHNEFLEQKDGGNGVSLVLGQKAEYFRDNFMDDSHA